MLRGYSPENLPIRAHMSATTTGRIITGRMEYFFDEKDKRKGMTKPGTKIDPIKYQSFTTEGIIKAKDNEIKAVTINPLRIKAIEDGSIPFFPKPDFFWILHNISRPKVRALINPSESIVDIIVARRPVINNPYANGGRTSLPSFG